MIFGATTMTIVLTGMVAFLAIILILVSTLLYAKNKLTAAGSVKVLINGEKEVTVNPGGTLLRITSYNVCYTKLLRSG